VPKNWLVLETDEKDSQSVRLDTDDRTGNPRQDRKPRFRSSVSVFLNNTLFTSERLGRFTSIEASKVTTHGHEPALRSFEFDGEKLSCVGGETFNQMLASARPSAPPPPQFYEKDPNIWTCQSSGRLFLQVLATDADLPQVWEIVSHIRKKS